MLVINAHRDQNSLVTMLDCDQRGEPSVFKYFKQVLHPGRSYALLPPFTLFRINRLLLVRWSQAHHEYNTLVLGSPRMPKSPRRALGSSPLPPLDATGIDTSDHPVGKLLRGKVTTTRDYDMPSPGTDVTLTMVTCASGAWGGAVKR